MIAHPLTLDLDTAVLTVYDPDGFLDVGIAGESDTTNIATPEGQHPYGFLGRPRDPTTDPQSNATLGCTVLRMAEGNVDHVIPLGDPRVTPTLPQIQAGDNFGSSLHYADTPQADPYPCYILLDGSTGNATAHVPGKCLLRCEVNAGPFLLLDGAVTPAYAQIGIPSGPLVQVDDTGVQLGAAGGNFVVVDNGGALTTFLASVASALLAAGHPVGAPPVIAATKVKAT